MRYLSLQQEVHEALDSDPEVGPSVLAAICGNLGWDFGARWDLDVATGRLRRSAVWSRKASMDGVGALRRVLALPAEGALKVALDQRAAVWNPSGNGHSPRDEMAAEAGLPGVAVVPIWRGRELQGLLEFRFRDSEPPTPDQLTSLDRIARVISDRLGRNHPDRTPSEPDDLFRHLFDLSPLAVIVIRGEEILHANEMAAQLLATSRESLAGRSIVDFVARDYRDAVREQIGRMPEARRPDSGVHFQWMRHDGEMIDVEVAARHVGIDGGAVMQVVIRDVSERMHREHMARFTSELSEALRPLVDPDQITETAAHMLKEVLHAMGATYAEVKADEDTLVVEMSKVPEEIPNGSLELTTSGFGEEALRMLRLNHPFVIDDVQTDPRLAPREKDMYAAFNLRATATAPIHKEGRFVAIMTVYDDHPRRWREDEVELIKAVADRCWESIARARALRELQVSEQRLRLAQVAGGVGVFEWDITTDRVIWSPELERLYGLEPGTFAGNMDAWFECIVPEDAEQLRHNVKADLEKGKQEVRGQFRAVLPDGSTRWLAHQARVTFDRNGQAVRMLGVNVNIDARKRAEAERELLLSQTEAARAEAEEANRAKSIFLTNMSHELRTPINAISGYADLMAMGITGPVTEKQRTHLERIKLSSNHLLTLVNEVLDHAKVESGQLTVERDRLVINDIVKEALSMIAAGADKHEVEIRDEASGGEPLEFFGDADRVRQILVNLLSNAVKFTPPGGRVTISSQVADPADAGVELDGAGQWLRVDVEDTGIGLPADEMEQIFAPFHQVDSGYTRQGEGTGLGLSISRRLARLMGGDLTVQSEEGKGSCFSIWLPMAIQTEEADRSPIANSDDTFPGLADIGMDLAHSANSIVSELVDRIVKDPLMDGARNLDRARLLDHTATFLVEIGLSLVNLEQGGHTEILTDGAEIQRTIAELHGVQRGRLGWTEEALHREFDLLKELAADAIGNASPRVPESTVEEASDIVCRLLERAEKHSAVGRARALREGG